jgi:hypothetical protein
VDTQELVALIEAQLADGRNEVIGYGAGMGGAVVAVGSVLPITGDGAPGGIWGWMPGGAPQPVGSKTAISAAASAVSAPLFLAFIAVSDLVGFRCEHNWARAE